MATVSWSSVSYFTNGESKAQKVKSDVHLSCKSPVFLAHEI
jgi:hypothetical protein